MSTTIAVQYAIHRFDDSVSSEIAAKRIGIGVSAKSNSLTAVLGADPIVLGTVNGFLHIQSTAPFVLSITDVNGIPSTLPVTGLFISYITAQNITVNWDSMLQKTGDIAIYWTA